MSGSDTRPLQHPRMRQDNNTLSSEWERERKEESWEGGGWWWRCKEEKANEKEEEGNAKRPATAQRGAVLVKGQSVTASRHTAATPSSAAAALLSPSVSRSFSKLFLFSFLPPTIPVFFPGLRVPHNHVWGNDPNRLSPNSTSHSVLFFEKWLKTTRK